MARVAAILRIQGRVQGVGFRWWTVRQAQSLGVSGWVRNRTDGSVEVMAIGDADAVRGLARLCEQGPSAARVTSVARSEAEDDGSTGFEERATA